jgi:hypothetical protein
MDMFNELGPSASQLFVFTSFNTTHIDAFQVKATWFVRRLLRGCAKDAIDFQPDA